MFSEQSADRLVQALSKHGVTFSAGLSVERIHEIETTCSFRFPADLRAFLMRAVPTSWSRKPWILDEIWDDPFPDWHGDAVAIMTEARQSIWGGILFDIEHANAWIDDWGTKPGTLEEALAVAKQALEAAPTMIPIFGNRFIPDEPELAGNPIFSIWQLDIIYYGYDLWSYFQNELADGEFIRELDSSRIRPIRLWSKMVYYHYDARPFTPPSI